MKTFDFEKFLITVDQEGFSGAEPLWKVSIQPKGFPPVVLNTVGAGPEEAVALSALSEMRSVLMMGLEKYISRALIRGEDPREVQLGAQTLLSVASFLGDPALAEAETRLQESIESPPERPSPVRSKRAEGQAQLEWAREVMERYTDKSYEVGPIRARIRVLGAMPPGDVAFSIVLQTPAVMLEKRVVSDSFLPAEVLKESIEFLLRAAGKSVEEIAAMLRPEIQADPAAIKAAAESLDPETWTSIAAELDRQADEEFEDQRRLEIRMIENRIREIENQINEIRRAKI
jgi:hypothetical protein